jgi:DNA-binding winged helix-turn-helix (wHTH) protein/TolB-like protein/lipoprotein NlpI
MPALEKCWEKDGKMLVSFRGFNTAGGTQYEFGPFLLDPSEHRLLEGDAAIPLAPKAFELLVTLIANHGHLVTREVLMQTVWPDSFVEETNLTVNISLLRKTLGSMPGGQPWIATVPKRGYRFDGAVTVLPAENGAIPLKSQLPAVEEAPLSITATENPTVDVSVPGGAAVSPVRPRRIRWVIAPAVLLVVALVVWAGVRFYGNRKQGQLGSVRSIAVLPFDAPGASGEDQYLGEGLTDAVITRLGRLSQLVVRPIGAVRSLGASPDPVAVGRQLNVQAVLQGTVQRVGDRTKVAVHLRRASDGGLLWSEDFDEQNSSDFEIEDAISQRLAKALTLDLSPDEARDLATPETPSSEAHQFYMQGRYYWNKRTPESVQKSVELFRQATAIDPKYAAAWSGMADAWILAGSYGNSFLAPSVAMPLAKDAAQKALALDPASAEAHTSLAYIHLVWDWDFAAAEQEFKRALALNPSYVNALHWYSHELVALGRISESHEESEMALGLDPTDVVVNEHMAWHHMMAREYSRSIPQAEKAIELDPAFVQAHRVLALDLLYTGRAAEACAEFEKGIELSHHDPVASAYLARCYAVDHREPEARKILADLQQAAGERYVSSAEIAAVYAALNDEDGALKWLDKACDEHAGALIYLNADRVWDPLRNNPHFLADVKRVNLPVLADEASR